MTLRIHLYQRQPSRFPSTTYPRSRARFTSKRAKTTRGTTAYRATLTRGCAAAEPSVFQAVTIPVNVNHVAGAIRGQLHGATKRPAAKPVLDETAGAKLYTALSAGDVAARR